MRRPSGRVAATRHPSSRPRPPSGELSVQSIDERFDAAPARNLEIWHHKIGYDAVNVTCRVEGVSPRPQLQLYRGDRPG